jgi:hypothetical protein
VIGYDDINTLVQQRLWFNSSNNLQWSTANSTSSGTITTGFTTGTWNHIAWTFGAVASYGASSSCSFYINGALSTTFNANYFNGVNSQYWDICSYPGLGTNNVYIDSYRYYERTLSAADVNYIYSTQDATNLP